MLCACDSNMYLNCYISLIYQSSHKAAWELCEFLNIEKLADSFRLMMKNHPAKSYYLFYISHVNKVVGTRLQSLFKAS